MREGSDLVGSLGRFPTGWNWRILGGGTGYAVEIHNVYTVHCTLYTVHCTVDCEVHTGYRIGEHFYAGLPLSGAGAIDVFTPCYQGTPYSAEQCTVVCAVHTTVHCGVHCGVHCAL